MVLLLWAYARKGARDEVFLLCTSPASRLYYGPPAQRRKSSRAPDAPMTFTKDDSYPDKWSCFFHYGRVTSKGTQKRATKSPAQSVCSGLDQNNTLKGVTIVLSASSPTWTVFALPRNSVSHVYTHVTLFTSHGRAFSITVG